MNTKETNGYTISATAGAYAQGLMLLENFKEELWRAYDKAFGVFDGVLSEEGKIPSTAEAEHLAVASILKPVEEYFKQRLAEEVQEQADCYKKGAA